jgi:hypothetical protein
MYKEAIVQASMGSQRPKICGDLLSACSSLREGHCSPYHVPHGHPWDQGPRGFAVVILNDGNDQEAWKGQPYDTDRGIKQTCSPQNESPTRLAGDSNVEPRQR